MSDRCEPPEHLRGVDGWHWVEICGREHCFYWWERTSGDWGWWNVFNDDDCRYLAPVAPPAVVRELVEALEGIAAPLDLRDVPHINGILWRQEAVRAALRRAKEAGV